MVMALQRHMQKRSHDKTGRRSREGLILHFIIALSKRNWSPTGGALIPLEGSAFYDLYLAASPSS